MIPLVSLYRTIFQHSQHLKSNEVTSQVRRIKRAIRKYPITRTPPKSSLIWLFEYEDKLRKLCLKESSLAEITEFWKLAPTNKPKPGFNKDDLGVETNNSGKPLERNQGGSRQLWLMHEARRFDEYNRPPPKNSYEYRRVQRKSYLTRISSMFLHEHGIKKEENKKILNTDAIKAILVTHWLKHKRPEKKLSELKPRRVDLVSVKRRMGVVSLLRVAGIHCNVHGLKRILKVAETDLHAKLEDLDDQLKLAEAYSDDPLDGGSEDGDVAMTEWMEQIKDAKRLMKLRINAVVDKLETDRKIMYMQRERVQMYWNYRHALQVEHAAKSVKRNPPKPLTLRSL